MFDPAGPLDGAARMDVSDIDIDGNVREYLGLREPEARHTSYAYCFNYFRDFVVADRLTDLVDPDNLEKSCLELGFYLASWGMMRGSSPLLGRSLRSLVPTLKVLAASPADMWALDVQDYSPSNIERILALGRDIRATLHAGASDILLSKIMLGTMGCVPAFDTNFKSGLPGAGFGPKGLRRVSEFYAKNRAAIEAHRVPTLDFSSGQPTSYRYTQAKVVDMIFFVQGSSPRMT